MDERRPPTKATTPTPAPSLTEAPAATETKTTIKQPEVVCQIDLSGSTYSMPMLNYLKPGRITLQSDLA